MVALPTPARAAIASIDSASKVWPSAKRSSTASMIASSARALRGRPGPLRSWSATTALVTEVMTSIVYEVSHVDQLDGLLLGQALRRRRRRCVRRPLTGQPDEHGQRAEQGEDNRADGRVVHRVDEGA